MFVDAIHHWKTRIARSSPQLAPHPIRRWSRRRRRFQNLHHPRQYPLCYSELPEREKYPNLHYWYLFISNYSSGFIQRWSQKHGAKKEEPKKEAANDDDFDPFADDGPAEAKPAEKPKKIEPKAKKPKPAAKSIVVFEVKIYDAETTNLDELAKKILAL